MNLQNIIQKQILGWTGKVAAHHISYLGNGLVHRSIPYNPLDPEVIFNKLKLMQSWGISTVISTWQGPWAPASQKDSLLTYMMCIELGMTFALLLDPGGMQKWSASPTPAQTTLNVTEALTDPGTQSMLYGPAYIPEHYVLDFNTGANISVLSNQFPGLVFLQQNTGFSWPMIPWNQTGYALMNALPTMQIPGLCMYFNDAGYPLPSGPSQSQTAWQAAGSQRNWTNSVWSSTMGCRVLENAGGQFFSNQIPTLVKPYPYVAMVTWDDYDENTAMEWIAAIENGINWSSL